MSKVNDLTGKKYNLLTVVSRAESQKSGKAYWNCICDCGNKTIVSGSNLINGSVKSCGCLRKTEHNTHHLSDSRLYRIWNAMRNRCNGKNKAVYKYYMAKGISVCDEWNNDFLSFYEWALSNGYSDDLTIDRIDNAKGYSPGNCRWVSRKEQANNRHFCKMITYNGKTQTLMQWCEELGLNYKLIHSRLYKCGWNFEKAISIPVKSRKEDYGL